MKNSPLGSRELKRGRQDESAGVRNRERKAPTPVSPPPPGQELNAIGAESQRDAPCTDESAANVIKGNEVANTPKRAFDPAVIFSCSFCCFTNDSVTTFCVPLVETRNRQVASDAEAASIGGVVFNPNDNTSASQCWSWVLQTIPAGGSSFVELPTQAAKASPIIITRYAPTTTRLPSPLKRSASARRA